MTNDNNIIIKEKEGILLDEQIERYLNRQMSEEESSAFEKELRGNDSLKQRMILLSRLSKGLEEVGEQDDSRVKEAFASSSEDAILAVARNTVSSKISTTDEQSTHHIGFYVKWLSVAASLALILGLGIYYQDYRATVKLGEEYAMAFPHDAIVRGSIPTAAETELDELFANVIKGENLDVTINRLNLLWELSTMDIYNDYTDYSAEIGWNLAIAYLKKNDKDRSKAVLMSIEEVYSNNSAIVNQVRCLLMNF